MFLFLLQLFVLIVQEVLKKVLEKRFINFCEKRSSEGT